MTVPSLPPPVSPSAHRPPAPSRPAPKASFALSFDAHLAREGEREKQDAIAFDRVGVMGQAGTVVSSPSAQALPAAEHMRPHTPTRDPRALAEPPNERMAPRAQPHLADTHSAFSPSNVRAQVGDARHAPHPLRATIAHLIDARLSQSAPQPARAGALARGVASVHAAERLPQPRTEAPLNPPRAILVVRTDAEAMHVFARTGDMPAKERAKLRHAIEHLLNTRGLIAGTLRFDTDTPSDAQKG